MQNSLSRRQVEDENVVADYGLNFRYTPNGPGSSTSTPNIVARDHDDARHAACSDRTSADQEIDLTGNLPQVESAQAADPVGDLGGAQPDHAVADRLDNISPTASGPFWRAAMDHIAAQREAMKSPPSSTAPTISTDERLHSSGSSSALAMPIATRRSAHHLQLGRDLAKSGRAPRCSLDQAGADQHRVLRFRQLFPRRHAGPDRRLLLQPRPDRRLSRRRQFLQGPQRLPGARSTGAGATNRWSAAAPNALALSPGTDFLPSEIQEVSETTSRPTPCSASAARSPIFGDVRVVGQYRLALCQHGSWIPLGSVTVPSQTQLGIQDPFGVRCAPIPPPPPPAPQGPPTVPGGVCRLGAAGYARPADLGGRRLDRRRPRGKRL